jgi:hypothetical protein
MASSSDWGKVDATSLEIIETSDFRNQSRRCSLVVSSLHKLRHRLYSWMWSAICIVEVCLHLESSSKPMS